MISYMHYIRTIALLIIHDPPYFSKQPSLFPLGGLHSEIWRDVFGNREGDTGKQGGSCREIGRVRLRNNEYIHEGNLNYAPLNTNLKFEKKSSVPTQNVQGEIRIAYFSCRLYDFNRRRHSLIVNIILISDNCWRENKVAVHYQFSLVV